MLIKYILLSVFFTISVLDALGDGIRYLIEIKKEPIAGWRYKLCEALMLGLAFSVFAFMPALNIIQYALLIASFIAMRYFVFDFIFLIVTDRKLRDFGTTSIIDKVQKWAFDSPFGVGIMISIKVLALILSMFLVLDTLQI